VTLPNSITLRCPDADPVSVKMPIDFAGDATLDTIRFDGPRLTVKKPGSHLSFVNDILSHGITVDAEASVAPGAQGTEVDFGYTTQVFDDRAVNDPARSPLLVLANGASINIDNSGIKMTDPTPQGAVEALRLDGNGDTLTLSGDTEITNAASLPGVHVTSPSMVTIKGAKFFADVLVENSDTDVVASNATFDRSALRFSGHDLQILNNTLFTDYDPNFARPVLTFQGHNLQIADTTFDTRGLVLPLPMQQDVIQIMAGAHDTAMENVTFNHASMTFQGNALAISGSTSFTNALLTFEGSSLLVTDALFSGQGIFQAAADSIATLTNVSIAGYTQYGYKVGSEGGRVSIMGGSFAHDPSVQPSTDGSTAPWALYVMAAGDTDSSVTSQGTTFDGAPPPQAVCMCVGPKNCGAILSVVANVPVSLCP
jgi:hypothetical protein